MVTLVRAPALHFVECARRRDAQVVAHLTLAQHRFDRVDVLRGRPAGDARREGGRHAALPAVRLAGKVDEARAHVHRHDRVARVERAHVGCELRLQRG